MADTLDIAFDCLPLSLVGRAHAPLDATPTARKRVQRVVAAIDRHGRESAYFLDNARCVLRLANSDVEGMVRFAFWGTVITDASDTQVKHTDLSFELVAETCGGIPAEAREWLITVLSRAVAIEFERYVAAGHRDRDAESIQDGGDDFFARGV